MWCAGRRNQTPESIHIFRGVRKDSGNMVEWNIIIFAYALIRLSKSEK